MNVANCKLTTRGAEVLAALLDCPDRQAYGYELIRRSQLRPATVYRTLRKMAKIGIVATQWVDGFDGKPRRCIYRIDSGRMSDAAALVARYGLP